MNMGNDCEKCLHKDVCDRSSRQMWALMSKEHKCSDFKDRTKYAQVVLCQYCQYRIDDDDFVSNHFCTKRPSNGGMFCEDDDFCSYGKERNSK